MDDQKFIMLQNKLSEIKKLCAINFMEIQHLRKTLLAHYGVKDDEYDHENSIETYMETLVYRLKEIENHFPLYR